MPESISQEIKNLQKWFVEHSQTIEEKIFEVIKELQEDLKENRRIISDNQRIITEIKTTQKYFVPKIDKHFEEHGDYEAEINKKVDNLKKEVRLYSGFFGFLGGLTSTIIHFFKKNF